MATAAAVNTTSHHLLLQSLALLQSSASPTISEYHTARFQSATVHRPSHFSPAFEAVSTVATAAMRLTSRERERVIDTSIRNGDGCKGSKKHKKKAGTASVEAIVINTQTVISKRYAYAGTPAMRLDS